MLHVRCDNDTLMTPDRQLEPDLNRFQVLVSDAGDTRGSSATVTDLATAGLGAAVLGRASLTACRLAHGLARTEHPPGLRRRARAAFDAWLDDNLAYSC